jgi:uncharacterized protein with GYD domain
MPTYISLLKWTDQGIQNVKDSPKRLNEFKSALEAVGGKLVGFYLTMGRYDMVLIIESPNDEVSAVLSLSTASSGSIKTETMKAFTENEYRGIIAKIK